MKMKYIGIGIIVGILVGVAIKVLPSFFKKEVEISSIKTFRYHYTRGYAVNSYVTYELEWDKKYTVRIKPYGESEEDAHKITVDKEFVEQLESILEKYHVGDWDGFDEIAKNVLDGDSFSMSISFQNGTSISASGYMKYPKNYGDVKKEIDALFEKLLEKNK